MISMNEFVWLTDSRIRQYLMEKYAKKFVRSWDYFLLRNDFSFSCCCWFVLRRFKWKSDGQNHWHSWDTKVSLNLIHRLSLKSSPPSPPPSLWVKQFGYIFTDMFMLLVCPEVCSFLHLTWVQICTSRWTIPIPYLINTLQFKSATYFQTVIIFIFPMTAWIVNRRWW